MSDLSKIEKIDLAATSELLLRISEILKSDFKQKKAYENQIVPLKNQINNMKSFSSSNLNKQNIPIILKKYNISESNPQLYDYFVTVIGIPSIEIEDMKDNIEELKKEVIAAQAIIKEETEQKIANLTQKIKEVSEVDKYISNGEINIIGIKMNMDSFINTYFNRLESEDITLLVTDIMCPEGILYQYIEMTEKAKSISKEYNSIEDQIKLKEKTNATLQAKHQAFGNLHIVLKQINEKSIDKVMEMDYQSTLEKCEELLTELKDIVEEKEIQQKQQEIKESQERKKVEEIKENKDLKLTTEIKIEDVLEESNEEIKKELEASFIDDYIEELGNMALKLEETYGIESEDLAEKILAFKNVKTMEELEEADRQFEEEKNELKKEVFLDELEKLKDIMESVIMPHQVFESCEKWLEAAYQAIEIDPRNMTEKFFKDIKSYEQTLEVYEPKVAESPEEREEPLKNIVIYIPQTGKDEYNIKLDLEEFNKGQKKEALAVMNRVVPKLEARSYQELAYHKLKKNRKDYEINGVQVYTNRDGDYRVTMLGITPNEELLKDIRTIPNYENAERVILVGNIKYKAGKKCIDDLHQNMDRDLEEYYKVMEEFNNPEANFEEIKGLIDASTEFTKSLQKGRLI